MWTDFEETLAGSLHERAETGRPIDPAPLLHAARKDGQRIQIRRRIVTTVVAAAAVTALTLAAGALARPSRPQPAPPVGRGRHSSEAPARDLALMPSASGIPGAVGNPELIGSDPRVLHLNIDSLAADARYVQWHSSENYESALVKTGRFQLYAVIARSPQSRPPSDDLMQALGGYRLSTPTAVTVGGQPATLAVGTPKLTPPVGLDQNDWRVYAIRWQPAPGVWATVEVANSSAAQAPRLAALVRFDRATRCAQPLAVDRPPTGSHLISCVIELSADRTPYAGTGLTYGDGQHVLQLDVMLDSAAPRKGGLPAGPYRVDPDPDGATYTGAVGPLWVTEAVQGKRHYTRQQVLDTFASLRPVGKVNDPSTYR